MSKRGFTLVEISAVVLVVGLLAAIVTPNVVAIGNSSRTIAFFTRLPEFAVRARDAAQANRQTIEVVFDDSAGEFIARRRTSGVADPGGDAGAELFSLSVPDGVSAEAFQEADQVSTASEWRMIFYPDGRSEGAAVELSDAGRIRALTVEPDGQIRLLEGAIPLPEERRWEAGQREIRI